MRCGATYYKAFTRKADGVKRATKSEAAPYSSMYRAGGTLPRLPALSLAGYKGQRLSRRFYGKNK